MATCKDYGISEEDCKKLSAEEKKTLGIQEIVFRQTPTGGVNTPEELKKFLPRYGEMRLMDIIDNLTKQGKHLGSRLFADLQDELLTKEAKTGVSVPVLAGTSAPSETLRNILAGGTVPGGAGSTASLTPEEKAKIVAETENIRVQQQLERERMAAEAAYRAQQLELQRQQALEERRQNLLSAALNLTGQQMEDRRQATETSVGLAGKDTFRFLGSLRGGGTPADVQTPYDIFKTTLAKRATAPLPNIGPNSTIEDLESALGKLQDLQQQSQQPQQGAFGFAGGGTALPSPIQANLVGEAGSQIAPGTEVMVSGAQLVPSPGATTVLPLGQGMAEGGFLTPQSIEPFPSLFRNLRSDIFGMSRPQGGLPSPTEQRSLLGFLPEGQTTGGATPREPRFGGGYGALATPLSTALKRGYQELVNVGKISQADADIVTNAIGELPNPRNAAIWFRALDPSEKEAVLSLYKLANVPEETFNALVASATIVGPQRRATSFAA